MKKLELRYVAPVVPITGVVIEEFETNADTLRDLLGELDEKYGGFLEMFVSTRTRQLNLNVMIYYADEGKSPFAVIDLDQPLTHGARVTFW